MNFLQKLNPAWNSAVRQLILMFSCITKIYSTFAAFFLPLTVAFAFVISASHFAAKSL